VELDAADSVFVAAVDACAVAEFDHPRASRVVGTARVQHAFCHLDTHQSPSSSLANGEHMDMETGGGAGRLIFFTLALHVVNALKTLQETNSFSDTHTYISKESKVLPYSLPNVGPGADPGV